MNKHFLWFAWLFHELCCCGAAVTDLPFLQQVNAGIVWERAFQKYCRSSLLNVKTLCSIWVLLPFKGEKPPPKSSMAKRREAGIKNSVFLPTHIRFPFVFPRPGSSQLGAKHSLESANILNMCLKGNQSDAEKWLCHIRHIFPTAISYMPLPVLNPLGSPLTSHSDIRTRSVSTPMHVLFPTASHLACPPHTHHASA